MMLQAKSNKGFPGVRRQTRLIALSSFLGMIIGLGVFLQPVEVLGALDGCESPLPAVLSVPHTDGNQLVQPLAVSVAPHMAGYQLVQPDGTTRTYAADATCEFCHYTDQTRYQGPIDECLTCHANDWGVALEITEVIPSPYQCDRCHAPVPENPEVVCQPYDGDAWAPAPLDLVGAGCLKWAYPQDYPFGFGSAQEVVTHSAETTSPKYNTDGDWLVHCVHCHNPHEHEQAFPTQTGRSEFGSYFREPLCYSPPDGRVSFAQQPFELTALEGPGSFADGPPYMENLCETCHTMTSHHQADGNAPAGQEHFDAEDCTSCHAHTAGFAAPSVGGSCVGCHASPQDNGDGIPLDGREAVVLEFPANDAHAHYGAELDDSACVVCHDQTTHMDGYVDLIDADTGSLYSFILVTDLVADPDVSNFCASCHDADGATRMAAPLDPFGNGNTPPDTAARFQGALQWNEWYGDFCFGYEGTQRAVNSHHDISDADQAFSGAKLECLNCHGAHSASATQPVADPFNPTAAWSGDDNGFCLACHSGGAGPADPGFPPGVIGSDIAMRGINSCDYTSQPWYVDYSWTHAAHGLDSKRGWPGYSGAPGYELQCMDCHDPHGSFTAGNPDGNPYMIADEIDGTLYVDDGARPLGFNGPPWDTKGTHADPVTVTISGTDVAWGDMCATCHTDWLPSYDWHSYCSGCQTCHGHGQAWQNSDWAGGGNDTSCQELAPGPGMRFYSWEDSETPPLHLDDPSTTVGRPGWGRKTSPSIRTPWGRRTVPDPEPDDS